MHRQNQGAQARPIELKFLMTSLHVICGLSPPIKNPGYTYALMLSRHPETQGQFRATRFFPLVALGLV